MACTCSGSRGSDDEGEQSVAPVPDPKRWVESGKRGGLLGATVEWISLERRSETAVRHQERILAYWEIGQLIKDATNQAIVQLSEDLRSRFPNRSGFSVRSLRDMRAFATAWPDRSTVERIAAQLSWPLNKLLLRRLTDPPLLMWYAEQARVHGWDCDLLALQIDKRTHESYC